MSKSNSKTTVDNKPMSPYQKILWMIINIASELEGGQIDERRIKPPPFPCSDVESLFNDLWNNHETEDDLQDARNEAAYWGEETDIEPAWSRHYESESRAFKFPDGTWVGWTRWFGGGKYGELEAINWEDDAYDLSLVDEKEVITVKRVFKKTEDGE